MKKFVKTLLASALAASIFVPALASAAPSHRCTVESNQLFYFMISLDDAIDKVQQDIIENYSRDNSLARSLNKLVDANRELHNNVGRQAMQNATSPYSYTTLNKLQDAATNYYNAASARMRGNREHLQHVYEVQWLVQEAKNEFDAQCRDNRKSQSNWENQWDRRPDHASVMNMMNQAANNGNGHANPPSQHMMNQMMAGYHGNHGQPETYQPPVQAPTAPHKVVLRPMDDAMFKTLKDQLKSASFDSEKEAIIKAAAAQNHFTVTQLRDMMAAESFDSAKLIYAEAVFPRLVDKSNWFILLKVMTFDSYKQKLQEIANRNL